MALVIYTKPGCPYCQKAREYYTENSIDFTDKDAQNDKAAQKEMLEYFGRRHGSALHRGERGIHPIGLGKPFTGLNDHTRLTGSLPGSKFW